jgi:hypothetical protein
MKLRTVKEFRPISAGGDGGSGLLELSKARGERAPTLTRAAASETSAVTCRHSMEQHARY